MLGPLSGYAVDAFEHPYDRAMREEGAARVHRENALERAWGSSLLFPRHGRPGHFDGPGSLYFGEDWL